MNTPFVFKKCKKCGKWLVANKVNFGKRKDSKDGLNYWCKECKNTYWKKYHEENKEKEKKRHKNYREENKEKLTEYRKKHREENKEYMKKYYEEHKEEAREYYEEHKEKLTEYRKKYREEHKEEKKKYDKKYYKTPQGQVVMFNGSNRRRQRIEQQGNGITTEQWLEMMKFFDWKCAYSGEYIGGEKNQSIRSIDHIEPLVKGGAHEIWNLVPMYRPYNSSKQEKDLDEWYPQQDFYDEDRVNKINAWREYAYNKWSNDEIQKTI